MSFLNRTFSNRTRSFIGQGFTNCIIPSFIKTHFLTNPHVYTPYTPYQAEISQGRLEMLHNYQTIVEDITQMDIAVASMIDNGQVAMDIITLMKQKTKKHIIYVQDTINIPLLNCMKTRAKHQNINLRTFSSYDDLDNCDISNVAGIIVQTPDLYGSITDLSYIEEMKERNSKLLVACHTNLLYLVGYDPQTKYGIDFMFGNGGNMGVGLHYGGPQPAFLASKKEHLRQLPGRIIGESIDTYKEHAYRMALQTREQHIKRERATSNVCTSQALLANMSATWSLFHGSDGLQKIHNYVQELTDTFKSELQIIAHNNHMPQTFDTISLTFPNSNVSSYLEKNNILHYKTNNDKTLSFTFDESHNIEDVEYLSDLIYTSMSNVSFHASHLTSVSKRNDFTLSNTDKLQDEQSMMRYLHQLQTKDYSMMNGIIPLGSCTMKHTPHEPMYSMLDDKYNIHPYTTFDNTPHSTIINELNDDLCFITGFDHISFQSQSGAMGEYAGLSTIRNYINDPSRNIILMPKSAHGTNAASAVLSGCKPVYIKETKEGAVDMDDFHYLIEEYGSRLCALMITYPSTYGLFEDNITQITCAVHNAGGQVYLDGANMNALVGMDTKVASLGFDVCHFNLHKTFCIPHGGGGPGMGPIGVKEHLIEHVPQFSSNSLTESISTSPYGSGSLLLIPHYYIKTHTNEDWKAHHKHLITTTKNVIEQLRSYYKIFHDSSPLRAHEFILDINPIKQKYKVSEVDISKRLMDYGFHAPTMSWPISGGIMIEITETEPTSEVKRFVDALISIKKEIEDTPELLRNAPHTQRDLLQWKYSYSINEACYPMKGQYRWKYWPTKNRINDVYGDKMMNKK